MKKLVYIGFAFKHHEKTHAGYHHIREYVDYDYKIDVQDYFNAYLKSVENKNINTINWLFWSIIKKTLRYVYILKCIILGIIHNNLVFHFIYGENIYFDLSPYIRKGNKVACTFHQPVEWFKNPIWEKRLRSIDEIIILSKVELSDFEEITGKKNIYFIPHGISTDFYKINNAVHKKHLLLTVGNWLRDYEFANKVYKELLRKDKDLKIVVVANSLSLSKIESNSRISLLQGITDEELLNLYQTCSVLFLPLIRFTANNALLEASAAGCNIVIASDFKDNCYIPNEHIMQCCMSVNAVVVAIEKCFSKQSRCELSKFIQKNYSWQLIGQKTTKVLKNGCTN